MSSTNNQTGDNAWEMVSHESKSSTDPRQATLTHPLLTQRPVYPNGENSCPEELKHLCQIEAIAYALGAIRSSRFPPHPDRSFRIFSVDTEHYVRAPRPLTEVGIAMLDPNDVQRDADGKITLQAIISAIKAYHLRFAETHECRNVLYVSDGRGGRVQDTHLDKCEVFMFGTSRFLRARDLPRAMDEILLVPDSTGTPRRGIFVGHAGTNETHKFARHGVAFGGYHVAAVENQTMAPAVLGTAGVGLGTLMDALGLDAAQRAGWHNAGNDAVFQLVCTVAASLKHMAQVDISGACGLLKTLQDSPRPTPLTVGSLEHCIRCNRLSHNAETCPYLDRFLECGNCLLRNHHCTPVCKWSGLDQNTDPPKKVRTDSQKRYQGMARWNPVPVVN